MCEYETPVVEDLGTLTEMTLAVGLFGSEDGAAKIIPTHHGTDQPAISGIALP